MGNEVNSLSPENLEIAEKASTAFSNKDASAIFEVYHDTAEIWHNYDNKTLTVQEAKERVESVSNSFKEMAFTNVRRFATEKGYVQQHDYAFTHVNGESLSFPGCQIVTVEDGKISRTEAYLDRAPLNAMLSAQ